MMDDSYTWSCCTRLNGPLSDRWPLSYKSLMGPDRVGVGDGTVGVIVGVFTLVAVLSLINVGVGVYVLVGGRVVWVGSGVGVNAVGVGVGVSVGREAATVGGTNMPASNRNVAPSPMKRPMPRYLTSACTGGGVFLVGIPIVGIGFDVAVDAV